MGRAQSFAAFERSMVLQDQDRFESNMLCVLDISQRTTAEGLTNFIEAKSGEEVVDVTIFPNGKALVTLKALPGEYHLTIFKDFATRLLVPSDVEGSLRNQKSGFHQL